VITVEITNNDSMFLIPGPSTAEIPTSWVVESGNPETAAMNPVVFEKAILIASTREKSVIVRMISSDKIGLSISIIVGGRERGPSVLVPSEVKTHWEGINRVKESSVTLTNEEVNISWSEESKIVLLVTVEVAMDESFGLPRKLSREVPAIWIPERGEGKASRMDPTITIPTVFVASGKENVVVSSAGTHEVSFAVTIKVHGFGSPDIFVPSKVPSVGISIDWHKELSVTLGDEQVHIRRTSVAIITFAIAIEITIKGLFSSVPMPRTVEVPSSHIAECGDLHT